ncbi:hypothetical protein [Cupriavidus lacunae]|uniref:hypothetical protein n=1 Tax=Cupriavidus lacunae TaxID=2666307 RepID=UPI001374D37A|nr:hypothetical protein [Cupriavidus lacunae]
MSGDLAGKLLLAIAPNENVLREYTATMSSMSWRYSTWLSSGCSLAEGLIRPMRHRRPT